MATETAGRDPNYVTTIMGLSLGSPHVPTQVYVDETTHRLLVSAAITSGGTTQYAEDSVHISGDMGTMALAVRNDTGSVLAGTDGDYVPLTTDNTGAMRIDMNGQVSSNNSSVATLTSNAVFTGTSEDALNYNEIRITVFADQNSATDGLSIQQSTNNTNWDIIDTYTITASTSKTISVPRQARYVRVVYTNGGSGQAAFRLQTILNRLGTGASSQRASDTYTNESDLVQEQAFQMVYNGTNWDRWRGQVADETSTIWNTTTALTPKFAVITASSSGATQIVAAVSSKKIRVISFIFQCNAAVNVKFQSHVTPTDKTGLFYNAANTGACGPYNPKGWFETISGEALDINLSGAVAVGGTLVYVEV